MVDPGVQQGIGYAMVGMGGVLIGKFFDWLTNRDKLRYDRELGDLKAQNATQATQMAAQATQLAALTASHAECEKKHKDRDDEDRKRDSRLDDLERKLNGHDPSGP